jgi:hypothetical protein
MELQHRGVEIILANDTSANRRIELIFRHLVRFGSSVSLRPSQGWSDVAFEQEVTVWILMVG